MKKVKFICLSLMMMVILGLSFLFVRVPVRASEYLWGAPESAKNFVDKDGKGIRLYIYEVYEDKVYMCAITEYQFADGELPKDSDYGYGWGYFDSDLQDGWLAYYLDNYPDGQTIPASKRTYVYFDVAEQCFSFEYHGLYYDEFWFQRYLALAEGGLGGDYNDGYNDGYNVGFDEGFDEGYDEAVNQINAIEKVVPSALGSIWLVVSDFLSIEILGIAIWQVIGSFVVIGVAIIIIRMFL